MVGLGLANPPPRRSGLGLFERARDIRESVIPSRASAHDDLIKAVIQAESAGNRSAVSPRGAVGLMQVMPETARDPGFGVTPFRGDDLTDEAENVRFGTDYLNAMLARYDGDLDAALVAYNAGPGVADDFVAGGKDPSALPAETQSYIQNVRANLGDDTMAFTDGAMNGSSRSLDDIRSSLMADDDTGVPQIGDDPVGAIGTILQEVGNAIQGKGSIIDQMQQRQLQRRALDLQMAGGFLNLIERGQEIAKKVPEDQQESAFALLNQIGGRIMPGFDVSQFVGGGASIDPETVVPRFNEMSDESRGLIVSRIKALGGDADALETVLTDDNFMSTIEEIEDERNRGGIVDKLQAVRSLVEQAGLDPNEAQLTVPQIEQINAQAPEGLRLSPSELRTLRSSPDLQRALGIQTEEAAAAGEETAAREAAKPQKPPASDLVDETGGIKTEATNAIRGSVAQLFGGAFDPSTGQFTGLSRDAALNATSLVAEAEALIKSGEADSVGQAVAAAAPKFGIDLPQPGGAPASQGNGGAVGTEGNPHQPTTQEEYNAIPAGEYFVDTDGSVKTKR